MLAKIDSLRIQSPREGDGNEYEVYRASEINGEDTTGTVVGIPSGAFFGWQTPKGEVMQGFIDEAEAFGFHFREGLQICEVSEDCEITREVEDFRKLFKSLLKRAINPGSILKFLTKQVNLQLLPWPRLKRYADFVRVEKYSGKPCMTMDDLEDPYWGPKLRDYLDMCERFYREKGLMADPLGGAAISGSIKYLFDPTSPPPLSNLEKGSNREVATTDAGLIRAYEAERVDNIPWTNEAMRIALRSLMELSYEGMNMALRDHGHDIEPRKWTRWSAVPKVVAGAGYGLVKMSRKFWDSKYASWVQAGYLGG